MKRLLCKKVAIVASSNSLDELCLSVIKNHDNSIGIVISNDVSILFNQERLNKVSQPLIDNIISNLRSSHESIFKNYSDDEISKCITSRYVQSCADVYNLQRKINNEVKQFEKDLELQKRFKSIDDDLKGKKNE